ncbi:MAG: xylan 1,4-beta-xylosidase [Christensenellaceae bacterium]|nr:xylan 1,4-beta-xylosidase [Christensenellaceae bacterium]
MDDKRFVRTYKQGFMDGVYIWVDRQTGVNYLCAFAGYGLGLTVLLDKDGKPVITPEEELKYL